MQCQHGADSSQGCQDYYEDQAHSKDPYQDIIIPHVARVKFSNIIGRNNSIFVPLGSRPSSSRNYHAWGQRCVWPWPLRPRVACSLGQILSFNSVNLVGSPKYSGKTATIWLSLESEAAHVLPGCPTKHLVSHVGSFGGQTL